MAIAQTIETNCDTWNEIATVLNSESSKFYGLLPCNAMSLSHIFLEFPQFFSDPEAMSAPDQLRQRMAWALSQVLVVGTGGFTHEKQNELWLNYYDILVRKAGSLKSDEVR